MGSLRRLLSRPGEGDPTGCVWTVVAAVVAVLAIAVVGVVHLVRDVRHVSEGVDGLVAELGPVSAYTPPADGAIPADRMEAYLAVRTALLPLLDELERDLGLLSDRPDDEGAWTWAVPGKVQAGLGLLPKLAELARARADAQIAHGIGSGEYLYLYTVTSYAWLGRSPSDGPPYPLFGEESGRDDHDYDEFEVREARAERIIAATRSWVVPMLDRQAAAVRAAGVAEDDPWRAALETELAALRSDPWRLPWAEGVAAPMAASFEPHRARLDAAYRQLCNPLEVELVKPREE